MTPMGETGGGSYVAVAPYTALAGVYDVVMQHVDYREWARYVHSLLSKYAPDAEDVLELGCGTGSLVRELVSIKPYGVFATDGSADMVRVARSGVATEGVEFDVADFRDFETGRCFDAALLLYDGINYLLQESEIEGLLRRVRGQVRAGGIFILDQSTPSNSLNNQEFFEDSGVDDSISYVRLSEYDPETSLHHTRFEIEMAGTVYCEHHIQRAYSVDQLRALVPRSSWTIEAVLDGFSEEPATDASERVHWILRAR
jgi:SAM-dependent methyltransferase